MKYVCSVRNVSHPLCKNSQILLQQSSEWLVSPNVPIVTESSLKYSGVW
jgi:hypothetical protein